MMFVVGQRWVSNSEAELGLGIIKQTNDRKVEIFFPAVATSRFYAMDNAPLSRVVFSVDEQVKTQEGVEFTITAVQAFNGCYIYQGETINAELISIHEMDLDSQVHFNQPQDRLFAGQVDKNNQFELRVKALAHQHMLMNSPAFGLLGARVQLLPHQLYIARRASQYFAPRVLLADEVGLGKTIEAGLILHQQRLSGHSKRALIIVPNTLLHQWLVEMLRRFNLSFTLIDKARFDALMELDEGNPFDSAQLVLCDLGELVVNASMQARLSEVEWDTLIVDEAHHLHWQPEQVSDEYALIDSLAARIPSLLLLTATPEQLGVDGHFARLRLLDPDKFHDLETFKQQEMAYQPINELIMLLDDEHGFELVQQPATQKQLATFLDKSLLKQLLDAEQFTTARQEAISQLLDWYGTGRVLFRNTRHVVKGFPQRILNIYPLSAIEAVATAGEQALRPETCLGENWQGIDTRVSWLVEMLKKHRQEKILLICARAETAQDLEAWLNLHHGVRSAAFHENMSLMNRDRAAAFFADDENGAQLLVCSEIGSEGRNFQFCRHLVLFDLPLNPELLEQRIGRLDRIGQQHDIQIHVPYYKNTAQAVLMHWYRDGLNAFEQVFSASSIVSSEIAALLQHCLQHPNDKPLLNKLIKTTQRISQTALEALQSGRNRLLERNSFDAEKAGQLVAELEDATRALELSHFMDDVFDVFGVEQQPHSSDSNILEPGTHMQFDFPGLPEDGLTVTYHRHRALSREDMTFLTWEHPMVLAALDLIINSELGNSAFCTLETDWLPAGTLLLEAILVLNCVGEAQLQTIRYMPQNHVRLLIDEKGHQYQEKLPANQFNKLAGRIPKATAQQLIHHAREQIGQLIEQAQTASRPAETQLKQQAMIHMTRVLDAEKNRLLALARNNPAIGQQEMEQLDKHKTRLAESIKSARLMIDAIRVAIVTESS